jgi:hypothetical protein
MVLACVQYLDIVVILFFRRLLRHPINKSIKLKLGEKESKRFFADIMRVDESLESFYIELLGLMSMVI